MDAKDKKTLSESIIGLVKFFNQEGYATAPNPKVIFSEDNDPSSITSPTGHYKQDDNTITLYTKGRSLKDILNTFSHELWHRHQDVEGKLVDLGEHPESYTKGSDKLREIEDEAFRMGNVMRRKYTESLQK